MDEKGINKMNKMEAEILKGEVEKYLIILMMMKKY